MTSSKNNNIENEAQWSHVQETIRMINVAVARIEHAMNEGNESVSTLTESFVEIVNTVKQIENTSLLLTDSAEKDMINEDCRLIAQKMQGSIIAFQFYDKLSQRMLLTSKTLGALTDLLNDQLKSLKPEVWLELQETVRTKYTLDADQQMFDDILSGLSVEEALKNAKNKISNDDIEFF